ncbi:sensor histidine kinase [Bacillus sp. ISL-40]|uniref:sensor histidine kinase n=1 Tax=unclassified Bacillus (in: firmicutes) TaxID=185979 RepID=UPI001BECB9BA|nr:MULTISPECIES: sensor histidine kinase [unclassified Bacillus (in: firmicutes)]MBT2698412.1 sensor histidine kinase [Bacillus sp. ISL-40]MBT2722109.1 sensor histidine kinase [Bacillus sp. ISL-46]MBT2740602.1 sensor histidine kinase [Bacillus sp. ISL-77]
MMKWWRKIAEFLERYILLKNQSLMIKLCIFSSFLVIFPVISVGVISYNRSSVELENVLRQSSSQVIDQVESHIEYYLQDFEITSLKIINSPELSSLLKLKMSENRDKFIEPTRNTLKEAEYSRADITNITILLNNNQVIDTLGNRNFYPATKMKEEYWYSSVPLNGMSMLVMRKLKLENKEQPVISLVRRLYNPQTLLPVGMLIIDINFRRIEEISNKVTISKNGYFSILDANGHYIYHPDYSKLGKKVEFKQLSNLKTEGSSTEILENERRDFVTYTFSRNLGWRFLSAVPYRDLTGGIVQIEKAIFLTILVSLIIAYLIGFGFATSIIRPIRRLQHFMKEVEIGKLDGRVRVDTNDEIGQLTAGFNNTVEKLSNLLEEVYVSKLKEAEMSLKQKEVELKMLQSQMNPHFLYNSLETIRGMALEENQENIATMSFSLGKLLRYNLNNHSSTVSFREEMNFCEMYLQIQKVRFEDRFEYMFDIPQWVMELKVVKFSLQPLVENCFVHGYGPNTRKLKIVISAFRHSESSVVIRISDTGEGIKDHILEEIKKRMDLKTATSDGKNIGIVNVHQRIHYLFGPEYGITIQSEQGSGTEVLIHLPILDHHVEEERE